MGFGISCVFGNGLEVRWFCICNLALEHVLPTVIMTLSTLLLMFRDKKNWEKRWEKNVCHVMTCDTVIRWEADFKCHCLIKKQAWCWMQRMTKCYTGVQDVASGGSSIDGMIFSLPEFVSREKKLKIKN